MKKGRTKSQPFGEAALTYIREKRAEKKFGRELSKETFAEALAWGNFLEPYVLEKKGLEKGQRLYDAQLPLTGEPDYAVATPTCVTIGDVKCPYTLESAALLFEIETGEQLKAIKPEYYWQLICNAALTLENVDGWPAMYGQLVVYVPRFATLPEICDREPPEIPGNYRFIQSHEYGKMPWIDDFASVTTPHVIEFEVQHEDIEYLNDRVKQAAELLY